jgi:hypothetical protein
MCRATIAACKNLCEKDIKILTNMCAAALDSRGRVAVEFKNWRTQFRELVQKLCGYLLDDPAPRAIGTYELRDIMDGYGGTFTIVFADAGGAEVWMENVLMQSAEHPGNHRRLP